MNDDPKYFYVGQPVFALSRGRIITARIHEHDNVLPSHEKLARQMGAQIGDPLYKVKIEDGFGLKPGIYSFVSRRLFAKYDDALIAQRAYLAQAALTGGGVSIKEPASDFENAAARRTQCGKALHVWPQFQLLQ